MHSPATGHDHRNINRLGSPPHQSGQARALVQGEVRVTEADKPNLRRRGRVQHIPCPPQIAQADAHLAFRPLPIRLRRDPCDVEHHCGRNRREGCAEGFQLVRPGGSRLKPKDQGDLGAAHRAAAIAEQGPEGIVDSLGQFNLPRERRPSSGIKMAARPVTAMQMSR